MAKKKVQKNIEKPLELFEGISNEVSSGVDTSEFKKANLSHYDILNSIFRGIPSYDSISDIEKQKNIFMLNRTLAIKYPLQAEALNYFGVDASSTVQVWKDFLLKYEKKGFVPGFCFRKGSKKAKEEVSKKSLWTNSYKIKYAIHKHCSLRDVDDMIDFFPTEMEYEFKKFVEYLKLVENPEQQISKEKI